MVRSSDDNAVDVLLLVEHFAEVRVARRLVELALQRDAVGVVLPVLFELLLDFLLGEGKIDVGEGNEIFGLGELKRVLGAHATESDDGEVDGIARRLISYASQNVSRNDHHAQADLSGVGDELAPRDLLTLHAERLL